MIIKATKAASIKVSVTIIQRHLPDIWEGSYRQDRRYCSKRAKRQKTPLRTVSRFYGDGVNSQFAWVSRLRWLWRMGRSHYQTSLGIFRGFLDFRGKRGTPQWRVLSRTVRISSPRCAWCLPCNIIRLCIRPIRVRVIRATSAMRTVAAIWATCIHKGSPESCM